MHSGQTRKPNSNIIDTGDDEDDGFEEIIFTAPSGDNHVQKGIEMKSFS